jgi:hypothetical protein
VRWWLFLVYYSALAGTAWLLVVVLMYIIMHLQGQYKQFMLNGAARFGIDFIEPETATSTLTHLRFNLFLSQLAVSGESIKFDSLYP